MKRLAILGSTGSIGRSALAVVEAHPDRFKVSVLTAGSNIILLEKQVRHFSPEVVAVADETAARDLRKRLGKRSVPKVLSGRKGVAEAASFEGSDMVLSAIVGAAGLVPTLSAVRAGKTIGLANKEALVMAGGIVMGEARKHRSKILPVDSEHSAIFQCIGSRRKSDVRRLILTASGGPFSDRSFRYLGKIKPEEALNHPRWKMGKKITIDSATLMNKGFEVIEAHHLFGLPAEKIDVVIHPESIVHSLVEFNDRGCMAQLSVPDMKGPIAYALSYPGRLHNVMEGLSLVDAGTLTFKKPQNKNFPCLSYAYEALHAGGTFPAVLNAANEVAVSAFLNNTIRFTDIPMIIRKTMDRHRPESDKELDMILAADCWARKEAGGFIKK